MCISKQYIKKQIVALTNLRFLVDSCSRIVQVNCSVHPLQFALSNLVKFSIIPIILSEILNEIVIVQKRSLFLLSLLTITIIFIILEFLHNNRYYAEEKH